jgi:hypothetical protein
MAKHEHMTPVDAVTHAALIGHLIRGTVVEGKSFVEAHADARKAVGAGAESHVRHAGPAIDEALYPSWAQP